MTLGYSLARDQVPVAFREHFILGGYRACHQPWSFYFASALRLHNETLNFWSHAGALLLLLATLARDYWPQLPASDPISWPFIVGYIACTGLFAISALAHLLHSKNRRVHHLAFMADYAGIGLFGMGTGLPHFYYAATDAFFQNWEGAHLNLMAALALLSCLLGCYFKARERASARRLTQSSAILLMYLWSLAPVLLRYRDCLHSLSCSVHDPILLNHGAQALSLALAGFFYGSHLPEALFPGRFDLFGHSHQLFHVLIYLNMHFGARAAFGHLQRLPLEARLQRQPNSLTHILWPILLVILSETMAIAALSRLFPSPTAQTDLSSQRPKRA